MKYNVRTTTPDNKQTFLDKSPLIPKRNLKQLPPYKAKPVSVAYHSLWMNSMRKAEGTKHQVTPPRLSTYKFIYTYSHSVSFLPAI